MMICTKCGGNTRVIDNSINDFDDEIYRKHRCLDCHEILYTVEREVEVNEEFMKLWRKYNRANRRYYNAKN